MFFLLRMAFWLGLVLILLPTGSAQHGPATADVGASDVISAGTATVQDMRGFCTRQPGACSVGSQVAVSLGYRAQAGAKMIYDFLTETLAAHDTGSATGSTGGNGAPERASQNTLTPADLVAPWHGPQPRKDAKHSA